MNVYTFRENVVPWLILGVSTIATIVTSSVAVNRYVHTTSASVVSLPATATPAPSNFPTPQTNALAPTPIPNAVVNTPLDSRCIVTLFGQRFDVTRLQTTHDGGNIFICGTDMTAAYRDKHGTSLERMRPYALSVQTGNSAAVASPVNDRENEDEAEDDD